MVEVFAEDRKLLRSGGQKRMREAALGQLLCYKDRSHRQRPYAAAGCTTTTSLAGASRQVPEVDFCVPSRRP